MQHVDLKATTIGTDSDLGQFEALVSAWDADREKDTIERTAFDETIRAWQTSGKSLPLLFEHSTTVVGSVDPHSVQATEQGLVVNGQVDRDTDEGKQAWRTIKAGTAGFSIGYVAESKAQRGGGRRITEIDLFEISITSKPMHPSTRSLGWKSQPLRASNADPLPTPAARRLRGLPRGPRTIPGASPGSKPRRGEGRPKPPL
jgi:HK97 family phage prohead protease